MKEGERPFILESYEWIISLDKLILTEIIFFLFDSTTQTHMCVVIIGKLKCLMFTTSLFSFWREN
jgi:hypothetical protein